MASYRSYLVAQTNICFFVFFQSQSPPQNCRVLQLDRQIEALRRCEYLKESEVKAICAKAREILVDESNVQRVDAPVTVSNLYLSFGSPV